MKMELSILLEELMSREEGWSTVIMEAGTQCVPVTGKCMVKKLG